MEQCQRTSGGGREGWEEKQLPSRRRGCKGKSIYLHVFKRDEINVEEISIAAANAKNVTSYGQLQEF